MNRFFGITLLALLFVPGFVGAQNANTTPTEPRSGETTQGQYVPLTGIPFITQDLLSDGCRDGGNPSNCETNLASVFQGVIIFLIGAGGILAVGYFMWGAIQYMTQDIPSMKQNGREKMLGAVGGLVAVLAAFTLLQTIAPGISDSIKNFNDYLKPVTPPDCLDTDRGCLKGQSNEGRIIQNDAGGDIPVEETPSPVLNTAQSETILHLGDVFLKTIQTGDKVVESEAKEEFQDWCNKQKESDSLAVGKSKYYLNSSKQIRVTVPVSQDSPKNVSFIDALYMCSKALEVKMTFTANALGQEDTQGSLRGIGYMLNHSNAVKDFKKKCEKEFIGLFPVNSAYKVIGSKDDGTGGSQITSLKGEMGYKEIASEPYAGGSNITLITHAYFYCALP